MILLNEDILILILNTLSYKDILNFSLINKNFNYIATKYAKNITQIIRDNSKITYLNSNSVKIILKKNIITKNLSSYFYPINSNSISSLFLENITYYNCFFDNLLEFSQLKFLYINNITNDITNNITNNITKDITKLTLLTNLTSLGLCNIKDSICNEYNFLKNMTKLKKLYLNNYYNEVKFMAPHFLNELHIQNTYNRLNFMQPLLNIKLIDISNIPFLYSDMIIIIIKNYYRTLEKLYINNSNIGDLIIHNISEYISDKIPSLLLDIYLKYNKFGNNSLIKLQESAENITIHIGMKDICSNNLINYNRIIIE